jgi:TonB family protein
VTADRSERARQELDQAERWLQPDPDARRLVGWSLLAAVIFHVTLLAARMPDWGPDPVRMDAPQQQAMQVKFLRPPAPPKAPPKPPEPVAKKIPKPDPTPDEPEPIKEAPPPAPEAPPGPPEPAQAMGPVRVAAGQGPGLIKKVEPQYPSIARAARLEGKVVVDAVILKDGSVDNVTVLSSTNKMFEQSCVDAVRRWRFTPGSQDVVLTVTVNFTLR